MPFLLYLGRIKNDYHKYSIKERTDIPEEEHFSFLNPKDKIIASRLWTHVFCCSISWGNALPSSGKGHIPCSHLPRLLGPSAAHCAEAIPTLQGGGGRYAIMSSLEVVFTDFLQPQKTHRMRASLHAHFHISAPFLLHCLLNVIFLTA